MKRPEKAGRSFTNGFSGPKGFRDFRETGSWAELFQGWSAPDGCPLLRLNESPAFLCRRLKVCLVPNRNPNLDQTVAKEVLRLRGHHVTPIQS